MDQIFYDELMMIESVESRINSKLSDEIVYYTEALYNNHYITESEEKNFETKVKQFFVDMISSLKTFYNNIMVKIQNVMLNVELRKKLKDLEKKLKENKEDGKQKVEVMDLWKYESTYLKMVDNLWGYANKFEKMNYKSVEQVDQDLEDFNGIVKTYTEKLDKIAEKKITMDIDKVLSFVQSELKGESDVVKTINTCITKLNSMKNQAEILCKKKDILGKDIIPRHVGLIRRVVNSISSFVKRFVVKFITVVVFIFA